MTDYQRIFNRLREKGLSETVALAFLGNWQCESNCEAYRVEGDFSAFRTGSKHYTQLIQSGAMSRESFGTDQRGYGLAQWTYVNLARTEGRKFDLYDFWTARGGAIDSIEMQCDFCAWELNLGYAHVKAELSGVTDLYKAVDIICRKYEQPAVNNVNERYQAALTIRDKISRDNIYDEPEPSEPPSDDISDSGNIETPSASEWPPRGVRGGKNDPGLCNGMTGNDITILQAILRAREYYDGQLDGQFDSFLDSAVKKFQSDKGLIPDGIVGPLTWSSLLKM